MLYDYSKSETYLNECCEIRHILRRPDPVFHIFFLIVNCLQTIPSECKGQRPVQSLLGQIGCKVRYRDCLADPTLHSRLVRRRRDDKRTRTAKQLLEFSAQCIPDSKTIVEVLAERSLTVSVMSKRRGMKACIII